jgi:hypothetical protein
MAFKHGSDAEVWLDGADLSTFFRDMEFSAENETAETTTFKQSWKRHIPGASESSLDLEGLYDPTMGAVRSSLGGAGAILTVGPAGLEAVGDRARLVKALTSAYAETSPIGGVVLFTFGVQADGTVGLGQALHPFGEDTNNTTGATKTDAAATSTGWMAHLHVSLVDGGSWVIKLQDASASNFSDGADVTGGAFTAATGPTSQRLVSASGATLRRYVRYVATRTGGSAGHGITFGLAYSRNV